MINFICYTVLSSFNMAVQHKHQSLTEGSASAALTIARNDSREFFCGVGAASINILTTFPINKIIFRQQLLGIGASAAVRQLQTEGFLTLYRGILPPMLQKTVTLSLMFVMYDKFNRVLCRNFSTARPALRKTTAAVLAGCCEAVFTPFERVQTLLQSRHYHDRYRNTFHAFRELGARGVPEYYRGLVPILLRNGPSNAVFFLFRDEVKDALPTSSGAPGVEILRNFVSGAVLGAVISTIFFPLNVIKTQQQSKVGGQFTGCRETFRIIYNERNRSLRAVFQGAHVNYTRALISWGIINASYELMKTFFYRDIDR